MHLTLSTPGLVTIYQPMNIMFDSLKYVMHTSLVVMMLRRGRSTMGSRAVTGRGMHSVTQNTAITRIRKAH